MGRRQMAFEVECWFCCSRRSAAPRRGLRFPSRAGASGSRHLPWALGFFGAAEGRFGFFQQLLALLVQRAVLPGQLAPRIPRQFPATLVKILAFLYQFLACVDQVIRNLFSFADKAAA